LDIPVKHSLSLFIYYIKSNPNVTPVVHAPRKVPYALRDKLKTELDRAVELGVIEKVNEPTEWVHSLVVVEKSNGKVRVCLERALLHALNRSLSSSMERKCLE
jgi:hypothetical protein